MVVYWYVWLYRVVYLYSGGVYGGIIVHWVNRVVVGAHGRIFVKWVYRVAYWYVWVYRVVYWYM